MTKKTAAIDLQNQTDDVAYEEEFIKAHRKHSFFSSLYFAVAGATFIGVLSTLSAKFLTAKEEGTALFKNKRTPIWMGGMMLVGTAFTYLSNKRETEKVRLEDLRLARRFADKPNAIEERPSVIEQQAEKFNLASVEPARMDGKTWQETVSQPASQRSIER